MTPDELRALADALETTGRPGGICQQAANYLRSQAEAEPVARIYTDGWKLVPVNPTPEMVAAAEKQWMCGSNVDMAKREWAAMLTAAPAAPQAEPSNNCRGVPRRGCNYLSHCGSVCNKCGHIHNPVADAVTAQAEPSIDAGIWLMRRQLAEAKKDARRYRWIAAHCRSTSEHWGGRWSIVVDGPCPTEHDDEDTFDDAIDAAIGLTLPAEES